MEGDFFSREKAGKLADEKLEKLSPVDEVIKLLQLNGDEKVLDLGAGNGYFTVPISNATSDRVVAMDQDELLLNLLAEELEKKNIRNIERMPGEIEFLNFPDRSFHRVLAPFIFHKLQNWNKTANELARVLNEKGRIVILEWIPKRLGQGPSKKESLSKEEITDELKAIGFHVETGNLNNQVYYITADKLKDTGQIQT